MILDLLTTAIMALAGLVMRIFRGVIGYAAVDATVASADRFLAGTTTTDGRARRRARRQLKQMAANGDIDELVKAYRGLPRDETARDLRIDVLVELCRTSPPAAATILREILESADDAYVQLAALDRVAKHRITALRDVTQDLCDDPRPLVSAQARNVTRRLEKAA